MRRVLCEMGNDTGFTIPLMLQRLTQIIIITNKNDNNRGREETWVYLGEL